MVLVVVSSFRVVAMVDVVMSSCWCVVVALSSCSATAHHNTAHTAHKLKHHNTQVEVAVLYTQHMLTK